MHDDDDLPVLYDDAAIGHVVRNEDAIRILIWRADDDESTLRASELTLVSVAGVGFHFRLTSKRFSSSAIAAPSPDFGSSRRSSDTVNRRDRGMRRAVCPTGPG